MDFDLRKASDYEYFDTIHFDTLEELYEFIKDNGKVIIDSDTITIYDSYIE